MEVLVCGGVPEIPSFEFAKREPLRIPIFPRLGYQAFPSQDPQTPGSGLEDLGEKVHRGEDIPISRMGGTVRELEVAAKGL
jgi:hypothetical protein